MLSWNNGAMGKRPGHHGRAFTLVELLVVSVLMTALTLMTAQVWRYFSVEMTFLAARARVAQELRFAVEHIRDDMGATVGAIVVEDHRIRLCKDAGAQPDGVANWGPPDIMVEYYKDGEQLVRHNTSSGSQIVVSENITNFTVQDVSPTVVQMDIEIKRGEEDREISRQVTLMWSRP